MTISTTIIKNSYSGNGSTTAFTYNFKITDEDDIQVIIRSAAGTETVKTKTTHYTVGGVGNNSGTVTFQSGHIPANGETVLLRRSTPKTQTMDLIDNDPMSADTIETAHDKSMAVAQELQEQIDRSIKLSRTNTMSSTEFTVDATTRANKILAFDSSGEIAVTQELGTFKGNWAASTAYVIRDIVKDTNNNNIYICITSHTSSGSVPISSNTDVAKWSLLVDAASASTSQAAAASSATAAANSATAAASSASTASTQASNASTSASTATTKASEATTAKNAAETAQAAAEAALDTFDDRFLGAKSSDPTVDNDGNALIDGALYFSTNDDVMKVYDLTNTTWRQLALTGTNQTNVNTVAGQISPTNNIATVAGANSNISTVAGQISPTNNIATLAGISGLSSLAAAHAAVTNVNNNLSAVQNFADVYRIASSAPTSSLNVGDLYFDTSANELKVYKSSGWAAAGSTVNGTSKRYIYNITGTPTTLTGASGTGFAEATSQVLAYDAGFVDVFHNGVKMVLGTDVTATSGTSLVFASALANGDVVDVVAYGTFNLASIPLNDLTDVSTGGVSDGQVLVYSSANSRFQPGSASSAEVYGFSKNASGQLIVTTTNKGADNISSSTYASFDDVLFAASGFTFSISNGILIATI